MAWRKGLLAGVLVCVGAMVVPALAAAQPSTFSETVSGSPIQVGGSVTLTFTIAVPGRRTVRLTFVA